MLLIMFLLITYFYTLWKVVCYLRARRRIRVVTWDWGYIQPPWCYLAEWKCLQIKNETMVVLMFYHNGCWLYDISSYHSLSKISSYGPNWKAFCSPCPHVDHRWLSGAISLGVKLPQHMTTHSISTKLHTARRVATPRKTATKLICALDTRQVCYSPLPPPRLMYLPTIKLNLWLVYVTCLGVTGCPSILRTTVQRHSRVKFHMAKGGVSRRS
jgi:hypothetical protein